MYSNRDYYVLVVIAILAAFFAFRYSRESYRSLQADYRYGFVDTNPARRVSDAFDSPDRSDVYEGLPLP
jgi:hypothetical protein